MMGGWERGGWDARLFGWVDETSRGSIGRTRLS